MRKQKKNKKQMAWGPLKSPAADEFSYLLDIYPNSIQAEKRQQ